MTMDRNERMRLFYQLLEWFEIRESSPEEFNQFDSIWDETDGFDGCEIWKISMDLRDRGFDQDAQNTFAVFFVMMGIAENWLLTVLGF